MILAISIAVFSLVFILNTWLNRFSDTADDAARSCESAVDIVDARIPAMIRPPTIAARGPAFARRLAITTITVSGSARGSITLFFVIARPTTPMNIATASEITTHTVATRLETLSFLLSFIAINLSRT